MNKQSRGLGRGLDALIPTMSEQEVVKELPINDIVANKYQPRNEFDEEALDELAESINQYGLLQPVIVRKILNGYESFSNLDFYYIWVQTKNGLGKEFHFECLIQNNIFYMGD